MKISYNWLKEHIELNEPAEAIANLLTRSGLEVEAVEKYETVKGGLQGVVIGKVLTCEPHPNADKLKKTTVDVGNNTILPIVCGAPNVEAGQKVLVATVGATLHPMEGEPFKISKAKIRGEVSQGMICAPDEIGIGHSHEGIMVLDTLLPEGTPAAAYFDIQNDHVLEIGLTPNRADAASHFGVARDLKALLKRKLHTSIPESLPADNNNAPVEIIVEDPKACPRYAGVTITGVTVKESPEWLKNKLRSIGLAPINNVVDITNFVLHDLGQPLHAFDLDKVSGKKVIVKTVAAGTEFVTLDGQKRKLTDTDLMICNSKEPMCIAGVFGGLESGVKNETKNIFLESACFSPDSIRKTSMHHGLKTDASFRFERGTDPGLPVIALKKAATLIKEIAGGKISSEIQDVYPVKINPFQVKTSYSRICKLIGKEIPKETIREILQGLAIKIVTDSDNLLMLAVPPYRVDVQREADIVEEILRIYGYDNIETTDLLSSTYLAEFPAKDTAKLANQVSQILVSRGFNEIITNSLTRKTYTSFYSPKEGEAPVDILNYLSEDLNILREEMLFSGLEVVSHNINRRQKNLKLFEFGKTYHKKGKEYSEKNHLSLYLTGDISEESWAAPSQAVGFQFINTVVRDVLAKFNVKGTDITDLQYELITSGIALKKGGNIVVSFGQVSNKILRSFDIKQPVWFADFDLDYIYLQYSDAYEVTEIPKFPEVRRDLSLVLDKKISFEQVRKLSFAAEKDLLQTINLFDVYEGDKIEKGKKSYSISFTLQDFEQTLTDKVIEKTMEKLMATFEKELGAVIRK